MTKLHISKALYYRESSIDSVAFANQAPLEALCGAETPAVVRRGIGAGLLHKNAVNMNAHCAACCLLHEQERTKLQ